MATRWYRAPELCGSFFSKVLFVPMMGIHFLYAAAYFIKDFLLGILHSCFDFFFFFEKIGVCLLDVLTHVLNI